MFKTRFKNPLVQKFVVQTNFEINFPDKLWNKFNLKNYVHRLDEIRLIDFLMHKILEMINENLN